jgi:hypothetical protein
VALDAATYADMALRVRPPSSVVLRLRSFRSPAHAGVTGCEGQRNEPEEDDAPVRRMDESRYDTIVVGSGHDGLVAAVYLARRPEGARGEEVGHAATPSTLPGMADTGCVGPERRAAPRLHNEETGLAPLEKWGV